jgi:hypothetical protein
MRRTPLSSGPTPRRPLEVFRVIVTDIQIKKMKREYDLTWTTKWEKALANVKNHDTREGLISLRDKTMILAVKTLVWGSPMLMLLAFCVVLTMMIRSGLRGLGQIGDVAASSAVARIVDSRMLEDEAGRAAVA